MQSNRQFSIIEYIGSAVAEAVRTARVAPGLNRRKVYAYVFTVWDGAHIPNVLQASIRFFRGGVECANLPLSAINFGAAGGTAFPNSRLGLACGGNIEIDSMVLFPGCGQGGIFVPGPLAGEAVSIILQPFYLNVDADEFQLSVDACENTTLYRIYIAVFSDLLSQQGY